MMLFVLVQDVFGNMLPKEIMGWWVPALFVGGLFTFVLYKLLKNLGYIDW